jgi:hypothetical protein
MMASWNETATQRQMREAREEREAAVSPLQHARRLVGQAVASVQDTGGLGKVYGRNRPLVIKVNSPSSTRSRWLSCRC